jgi:hypothetical protein
MPKFLNREEVYRLLQRELPDGVYADGAPSAFYSTADMDSVASGIAKVYSNLERVYENYWPQTADERIDDWELVVLNARQDAALTLASRRDKVLTKLRSRQGITISDMKSIVWGVIGSDKTVEIREWGCESGAWVLDESELDINTYLGGQNRFKAVGSDATCSDGSEFGFTAQEWEELREETFTFEVCIYDYTLSTEERRLIDERLTAGEPARSAHVITDGLDSADLLDGET